MVNRIKTLKKFLNYFFISSMIFLTLAFVFSIKLSSLLSCEIFGIEKVEFSFLSSSKQSLLS